MNIQTVLESIKTYFQHSRTILSNIKTYLKYFETFKQAANLEANITMTSTSTANLYNVEFRGSLKDSNGNKLEIYNSSGTKIWG